MMLAASMSRIGLKCFGGTKTALGGQAGINQILFVKLYCSDRIRVSKKLASSNWHGGPLCVGRANVCLYTDAGRSPWTAVSIIMPCFCSA